MAPATTTIATTTVTTTTVTTVTTATVTTTEPGRLRTLAEGVRSVRVRVLASVLLLTALGMALAGVAVYLVQNARIEDRVKGAMAQEVDEFDNLQQTGIDPQTGRPFRAEPMERLFLVALQRNVPDRHEALLAVVDGTVRYYSPGPHADRLRADPALLAAVVEVIAAGHPAYRDVETARGHIQLAVKPVVQGERTGAWVVAYTTAGEKAEFADVVRTYALVALGVLLVVAIVGWFVAGRLLAPIRVLRRTAQQITETDLTRRIQVTGHDDVSELTGTFNTMLDRLEEAFTTQRQFLDDAGHELRTPITIVRGHLELLDGADPAEVDETKALVLDELDRMARMVDDLVTLAKAERPDFLRQMAVNVGMLVDDVFDKARALGERRWRIEARADAIVLADPQRLTQALVQLAHNAVTLTGEEDTVAFGSAIDLTGTVRLWVRDTGPGVAPDDADRIFERFQRGAGNRRAEGSGLGLAIVRAIAEAHGGRVALQSRPGRGATFILALPMVPATEPSSASTEAVSP
jgi:two-component system OmpR family sensor kinase